MAPPPVTLNYARPTTRRRWKWLGLLVAVLGLAFAGWSFRDELHGALRVRWETWQFTRAYDRTGDLLTDGLWLADESKPAESAAALQRLRELFRYYRYPLHDAPITDVLFIRAGESDVKWLVFGYATKGTMQVASFERSDRHFPLILKEADFIPPAQFKVNRSTSTDGGLTVRTDVTIDGVPNAVQWTYHPGPGGSWGNTQNREWVIYDIEPLTGWDTWTYDTAVTLHTETTAPQAFKSPTDEGEGISFLPDGRLILVKNDAYFPLRLQTGQWEAPLPRKDDEDGLRLTLGDTIVPRGGRLPSDWLIDPLTGAGREVEAWTTDVWVDDQTVDAIKRVSTPAVGAKLATIDALAISGERIAFRTLPSGPVLVRDTRTGDKLAEFNETAGWLHLSFSPDGQRLVTVSSDIIHFIEADGGRLVFKIPAERNSHRSLVRWSRDGRLAGTCAGGRAYVWTTSPPYRCVRFLDEAADRPRGHLFGYRPDFADVAFTPDGQGLALLTADSAEIRYWPTLPAPLAAPATRRALP